MIGYTLHIADPSDVLGWRSEDFYGDRFALNEKMHRAGAPVLVWPKDQDDDGGRPLCLVDGPRKLFIKSRLDDARYIGTMWGSVTGWRRDDWHGYPENGVIPENPGEVFRAMRAKFGRCTKKTVKDSGRHIEWTFGKVDRSYEPVYVETVVILALAPNPPLEDDPA